MAIEIERKFLVLNDEWRRQVRASFLVRPGYFSRMPLLRARIRMHGDKGFISLKSQAPRPYRFGIKKRSRSQRFIHSSGFL